ncbi:MAG TPA: UDP-N-acetylmuramoyl-L-alanyl-D-glutamate--2,6-diaminopimelate ligase [Planctomycetota bacterium]|nr:UDP-N-acetylmuramoyl-L-alanyl-D-glutamate--2,6-diaminopimelate ligase [Planctomycetota bacterium]
MTELAFPSGLPSGQGFVRLRELRDCLQPLEVLRWRDLAVDGLAFHSAEVRSGNLFFAIRGAKNDGTLYAQQAVGRGAVAIVAEEALPVSVPVLVVANAREALADAARYYYRDPSRAVSVVGVTGTNGKTTTSHLIRACLQADRRQVGLLGTIAYEFGGRRIPAANTTPDPVRIHGYLREMADRFASACVLEVSSHSLDQDRVRGVRFATAVFTNLTQDHLDYHGTMAAYRQAKARLFKSLQPGAAAVLNRDDPTAVAMADELVTGVRTIWYGLAPDAEVRAENLRPGADGTRFSMVMPNGRVELFLRLVGLHNVHNALAAAAAALSLGASELTVASALEDARCVPGRLELVETPLSGGARIRTFVDYAHTPDALEKVCATLAEVCEGRLHVVFGCGGDRDRSKRAPMAAAVARHAHVAYLTSDNPRSEDPEAILADMEAGWTGALGESFRVVDRAEAIRLAIAGASPGDTVLIAGKGHETYQIFKDSVVPFDDRLEAARALAAKEAGWLHR